MKLVGRYNSDESIQFGDIYFVLNIMEIFVGMIEINYRSDNI